LQHHLSGAKIPAVDRTSHVYLLASKSGVLYIGVTANLAKRIAQHKSQQTPSFTQKYNVTKLVWFEPHAEIRSAISREKEIKSWRRSKKVALIESLNPQWNDLSLHSSRHFISAASSVLSRPPHYIPLEI
jgi:putative endonuclease